jgi:hypothetical protein
MEMNKPFSYALAIVLCVGATVVIAARRGTSIPSVDELLNADGAFRDGVYLGKLAAGSGQPPYLAVGRWSTEQDRRAFIAGYRRGYGTADADAFSHGMRTSDSRGNAGSQEKQLF